MKSKNGLKEAANVRLEAESDKICKAAEMMATSIIAPVILKDVRRRRAAKRVLES